MHYKSLRVVVTDWGNRRGAEYFSPLGSPLVAGARN
jgi:hypothetical protein